MNLQVLVALAEIVSALAVTLTLIVLIISIRQNTRSQKALVVDSLAAAITSINVPAMESHVLGSALSKATADGREYFENTTTLMGCAGHSGQAAKMVFARISKVSFGNKAAERAGEPKRIVRSRSG